MTATIKCRLYPTFEQRHRLEQTLDGCRWVYNYFRKTPMSVEDMQFALVELKESHSWLRNYHSKTLQMVVHQVHSARSALATLKSHGWKTGKLQYSEDCNTFVYNQSGFNIIRHGDTDLLWLSKIGYVGQLRLHKTPVNIKQISISRKPSGKWFANIVCEEVRQVVPSTDTKRCVGIDVGVKNFIYDSDDNVIPNPQFLKSMLRTLRRADRKVSRRQYGSNNYNKAKHMRARLYERIYNKRHDFLHKMSSIYAKRYDLIFIEKLQLTNMVKNHRLATAMLDSGFGYFKQMLWYKAKIVVEVNPAYTSIECSGCHEKVPKSLAVRTHRCPYCCLVLDRDHNSAINIEQRGRALLCLPPADLPQGLREVTPVELQCESWKQEEAIGLV